LIRYFVNEYKNKSISPFLGFLATLYDNQLAHKDSS